MMFSTFHTASDGAMNCTLHYRISHAGEHHLYCLHCLLGGILVWPWDT